ncbi:hypothetical protein LCGC14_1951810 [marine sediment metagenome]|uniref:Uncharacterized protein n=1 Tax=marine sediment metagenome TaxID=412755 RepID=A0A0F9IEA1_9ZZZZ
MAKRTWNDPDVPVVAIGEIELVIKWPVDDGGNPLPVVLFANAEKLDANGASLGRRYVRDSDDVAALFTAAQLGGIDAVGVRLRAKAAVLITPTP